MPEMINTSPLYMAPGEFHKRMQMAQLAGKPLEYVPRKIRDISGLAQIASRHAMIPDSNGESAEPELFIRSGRTAVLPIDGPIFFAASFWAWLFGGMTNPMIVRALDAALNDENIDRIVLDFHSPGGDVAGMDDLVDAINKAVASKPVIAMVHDMAASAAYWMACRCSRVIASPSAIIGSIGAISVYYDDSQWAKDHGDRAVVISDAPHKAMGHYGVVIDEQMVEREMKLVGDMSSGFRQAVSDARGISTDELLAMGGSMHYAPDAHERGLIDEIVSTADFYAAVDAGEFDRYGPDEKTTGQTPVPPNTENEATTTSGRSVAQTENRPMTINVDETVDAMTDEEKEEMRAKLGEGDDTTTDDDDNAGATTEEDEGPAASTEEEEEPTAKLSVKEIKAIIADVGLPKAMASELALEAVEKNYTETTLLRKCIKESNSSSAKEDAELESQAAGSASAIGGGAGSSTGGSGSAKAELETLTQAEMKQHPGMAHNEAARNVLVAHPKLAGRMQSEAREIRSRRTANSRRAVMTG